MSEVSLLIDLGVTNNFISTTIAWEFKLFIDEILKYNITLRDRSDVQGFGIYLKVTVKDKDLVSFTLVILISIIG